MLAPFAFAVVVTTAGCAPSPGPEPEPDAEPDAQPDAEPDPGPDDGGSSDDGGPGDGGPGDGGPGPDLHCPLLGQIPAPEVCNGFDDDCDGVVDEGVCDDLCDEVW